MQNEIVIVKELASTTLQGKWLNPDSYIITDDNCAFCRAAEEDSKGEIDNISGQEISKNCTHCRAPYLLCCGSRRPTASDDPECLFDLISFYRSFSETTTFQEYQRGNLNAMDSLVLSLMIKALRELAQRGQLKRGTQYRITKLVREARNALISAGKEFK